MGYITLKKEKEEERAFDTDVFFLPGIFLSIICITISFSLLNFFLENNKWWITITVNISIFCILQFLSILIIGFPIGPLSYFTQITYYDNNPSLFYFLLFLDEFLITTLVSFGIQKLF